MDATVAEHCQLPEVGEAQRPNQTELDTEDNSDFLPRRSEERETSENRHGRTVDTETVILAQTFDVTFQTPPLGFSFKAGGSPFAHQPHAITLTELIPGGQAASCGLLEVGDVLLMIGGRKVPEADFAKQQLDQVRRMLAEAVYPVSLTFYRPKWESKRTLSETIDAGSLDPRMRRMARKAVLVQKKASNAWVAKATKELQKLPQDARLKAVVSFLRTSGLNGEDLLASICDSSVGNPAEDGQRIACDIRGLQRAKEVIAEKNEIIQALRSTALQHKEEMYTLQSEIAQLRERIKGLEELLKVPHLVLGEPRTCTGKNAGTGHSRYSDRVISRCLALMEKYQLSFATVQDLIYEVISVVTEEDAEQLRVSGQLKGYIPGATVLASAARAAGRLERRNTKRPKTEQGWDDNPVHRLHEMDAEQVHPIYHQADQESASGSRLFLPAGSDSNFAA